MTAVGAPLTEAAAPEREAAALGPALELEHAEAVADTTAVTVIGVAEPLREGAAERDTDVDPDAVRTGGAESEGAAAELGEPLALASPGLLVVAADMLGCALPRDDALTPTEALSALTVGVATALAVAVGHALAELLAL